MNFKKIMLVTFVLLAIVTIGAVSASDDSTANGNLTASDIAEGPVEDASGGDVIAEVPIEDPSDDVIAEVSSGEASGDNVTAETPDSTVGFDADDFNVWINNKTLDIDKDQNEVAITFTSPEGADGQFDIFIDGAWVCYRTLDNYNAGQTLEVTLDKLCISQPGNHSFSYVYDHGPEVFAGILNTFKEYSRDDFDTMIFENVPSITARLYYLNYVPTQGTFIVYVNGEERYSQYIEYLNPFQAIYVDDLNITYNDYFNVTTEYVINSTGQVVALDSFICNVYCMPISIGIEGNPVRISVNYDSVGHVWDDNYINGTVLVYVDNAQIYTNEFSASDPDPVAFFSFYMDELKLLDNITHGYHAVKIVYKKNGDADYSKEALVFFQASAKFSSPSTINQGEDKYITVTYLEGTTGKVTVKLGIKERWGEGPYDYDFYEGNLLMTVDVVNGVAKIPLKTLPAGYQGLFLDVEIGNYTTDKLVRIDVVGLATKISVASKVTTTYGTSKKISLTLKDAKNTVLASKKVTITLNGKTYKATTNKNGVASVTIINTLPVKSYFATVAFAGDSQYKKSSVKITVTVSKANSKLTAAAKTFKRTDKTKKYIVTLKTDKNAAYKNAKVTIKVNKVTYSAKTNSKGQATFKLTKLTKNGRYSASVKFAGDSKYKASSKSVKIVVK